MLVVATIHLKRRRRLLALAVKQTAGRETWYLPVSSIRLEETTSKKPIRGPLMMRWRTRRTKPREKLRARKTMLRLRKRARHNLC